MYRNHDPEEGSQEKEKMNKQTNYKSDGGQSLKKKKKKKQYANLTDKDIHDKALKKAHRKFNKSMDSIGTDNYVKGSTPEEYSENIQKTMKRLKKKRAGTGNHPLNR